MKNDRQKLAAWGESKAASYLEGQGFQVIARNVRTRSGEIDLIARQDANLSGEAGLLGEKTSLTIFVEVKTRRSTAFGYPEQAVTSNKLRHMLAAAEEYIQNNPEYNGDWRVDVIAILFEAGCDAPEIRYFENVVSSNL